MHGVHQDVDPCNGNVIPLFMQGMSQLSQISEVIWVPPNPLIQFIPQVFSQGQIWTECWPVERVYVVSQKLLANSSNMGPGFVRTLFCMGFLHFFVSGGMLLCNFNHIQCNLNGSNMDGSFTVDDLK